MNNTLKELTVAVQAIYDKKGFNILVLDVRDICTMTDYFIIAEGNVDRHVSALAGTVQEALAKEKLHPFHIDGQKESDWMVLDYGDIVVHLFIPELREKYALEELWRAGKVVDIKISIAEAGINSNKNKLGR